MTWSLIIGVVASLLAVEIYSYAPKMARWMVRKATLLLAPDHREDQLEEWQAHVDDKEKSEHRLSVLSWSLHLPFAAARLNRERGTITSFSLGVAGAAALLGTATVVLGVGLVIRGELPVGSTMVWLGLAAYGVGLAMVKGGDTGLGIGALAGGAGGVVLGVIMGVDGGIALGVGGVIAAVSGMAAGAAILAHSQEGLGGAIASCGAGMAVGGVAEIGYGNLVGGVGSIAAGCSTVAVALSFLGFARSTIALGLVSSHLAVAAAAAGVSGTAGAWVGVGVFLGATGATAVGTATWRFGLVGLQAATTVVAVGIITVGLMLVRVGDLQPGVGMLGCGVGALAARATVLQRGTKRLPPGGAVRNLAM